MTELSLILAIAIVGLGASGYLLRWVLARPLGDAEMNRVANLVREVCEGFMRRQSGSILALSGLATGSVFLAYGLRRVGAETISRLETGVWLTVSCALGAASVIVIAQVGTFVFTRTVVRIASGARRSVDSALVVALRGGGVVGLVTTTVATLATAGLALAILLYHGALSDDRSGAVLVSPLIPTLVVGFPLGATFAALLCHLSGGFFAKSTDIGGDVGGREAGLADDDAENPAAIANLAGDCVGECVGQSTAALAAAATEDLAVMLVGASVFAANASMRSAITVILLPILARSFGLLGATFGAMVVRTDESEKPESALYRGFVVAAVLHGTGFVGAAKWLLPSVWHEVAIASLAGVLASFVLSPLVNQFSMVRSRVRELAETSRAGPGLNVLGGVVAGVDAVIGPALMAGVLLLGAYVVGSHTQLTYGGLFGIGVAIMGMAGASPYLSTVASASTMLDAAAGIVVISVGRERPDVRGRLLVLDTVGTSSKAFSRAHAAVLAVLSALLLVDAFVRAPAEVADRASLFTNPLTYAGGLLGVVLLLWFIARSTSGVTRCARRIVDEVRRQLGGLKGAQRANLEGAATRVDYGPCVEIASRFALRHMLVPGAGALVLPVVAVMGLHFASRAPLPPRGTDAIAALAIAVALSSFSLSIAIAGIGAAWANAKKYILTGAHGGRLLVDEAGGRAENPTFYAASVGDTVGDALKDVGVPVAQLFARLVPVIALIVAPFLS